MPEVAGARDLARTENFRDTGAEAHGAQGATHSKVTLPGSGVCNLLGAGESRGRGVLWLPPTPG